MTVQIPAEELAAFMQLPVDIRADVELWHAALSKVTKPIQASLATIAASMGVSAKTARRKYDNWRNAGYSWRALVNRAKVPDDRGLDRDFIAYWQGLCQQNGRKCAPAYREFVRQFKSGAAIPGIHPATPRSELPPGFSYDNLMRHKPSKFELTASRIGRGAAAQFRPKVYTTRVGLAVGGCYIFDDMWHDFKVSAIGQRRAMRLLQLHAHDLFSACQFARGIKPRMENPDGTSIGLTQNEMLFLVAHVLTEFGYHPDGCILRVEHGTAALSEAIEKMLLHITGGKVTVDRSGISGASAFAGQYGGSSKGNFRFKAALESLGNLIHNETANMLQFPGQTGSNSRINAPEELHGRDRHAVALLNAVTALPPERAALLRLPVLEVNHAKWFVEEVSERINQRQEHELEGWLEAGLTTMDFEIPGVGLISAQKYLSLPADKRAAIDAVANPMPRKLSPREVFDAGRVRLVRLRPEQTALLLRDFTGREASVGKDHLITLEDETISPAPLRYLAHHFAPGDKFTVVVNPMSPNTAHLFDERGAWVGVVDSWQTVQTNDIAGLERQMGAAAKVEKELLTPVAAAGAAITRKRLADAQHNAAVLDQTKPLTNAEKASAALVKAEGAAAAADILAATAITSEPDLEISSAASELLRALKK